MTWGMMRNLGISMNGCSGSFDYQCRVVFLFGVDVVIVSHEIVPFKLGVSKEFWDL
jgi:hypothetical protein